jgi:G3E family GTPase
VHAIPFHILTGFLGSGKTTVLAHLLQAPAGERVGALVNDVGDIVLDPLLLERVDDDVLALASGCVCCAVRCDLVAAVTRLLAQQPTRIVLETTGLADPAPLLHALATDRRLAEVVRPAGVCAVVDALRAQDLLAAHPEARRQVELADRILLTKADLAPHRLPAVRALLEAWAPGCQVREALHGEVDARWLFDAPPLARLADGPTAEAWLHHGPAGTSVRTHALEVAGPVDVEVLQLGLRTVTQLDGLRLLRVKAVAEALDGTFHVLQAAGSFVSPVRRLEGAPPGLRGLRMVVVERGLGDAVPALLEALRSAAVAERAGSGPQSLPSS